MRITIENSSINTSDITLEVRPRQKDAPVTQTLTVVPGQRGSLDIGPGETIQVTGE